MQSRVLAILIAVVLALVATAALVVYVNGADRRAIANQRPVVVLVAKEPIKAGTSGEDAQNRGQIEKKEVPQQNAVSGSFRNVGQLEGRFAAVDIVKGEQLLQTRWVGANEVEGRGLLPIPDDSQALSIGLDMTRQVAGFVTPGDNVGMVLTLRTQRQGTRPSSCSRTCACSPWGRPPSPPGPHRAAAARVNQGKGSQNLTAITLAIKSSTWRTSCTRSSPARSTSR